MQHVAFNVDTVEQLVAMRDRIRSRGINVFGQIDHGMCQSIYFAGPENLVLEVATSEAAVDPRAWIDPEVVALAGISEDELARFVRPAAYAGEGGSVAQPPVDMERPQLAYPKRVLEQIMSVPDDELTNSRQLLRAARQGLTVNDAATPPGTPPGCERIAYVLVHREDAAFSDTYGGGGNIIGLDCHLVRPSSTPSNRVLVFMHPTGGGMYLPIIAGSGGGRPPRHLGQLTVSGHRLGADHGEGRRRPRCRGRGRP